MGKKSGAHSLHRLSALKVQKVSEPGMYPDGGDLYLKVVPPGSKTWVFRYMLGGRRRDMGLGALRDLDLAGAREAAREARELVAAGIDPIDERARRRAQAVAHQVQAEAASKTWRWCCETYVATVKAPELTNAKHVAQWLSSLATYTYPKLGDRPVGSVAVEDVHAVLEPIWLTINETASRVRSRMEAVLGWATVRGYRSGDNPAAWRGRLEHLLAKPSRVQDGRNYPSLPYPRLPEFLQALRAREGVGARALELLILTAQRTGPVIAAKWPEIDLERRLWTSPAENMKMPYPHRVPLPRQAVALLREQLAARRGDFVFQIDGHPLSNAAMNMVINKGLASHDPPFIDPVQAGRRITPHGFRSSFRDWAAEVHHADHAVAELCLAHSKGDKTVAAYLRADLLERRRPVMQAWADWCEGTKNAQP